jgi:hypothetical protein
MMEKEKTDERKFYGIGIILSILAAGLSVLMLPVEGIVASIISFVVNMLGRKKYRVKIGLVVTILAFVGSVLILIFMLVNVNKGLAGFDYWLFR